jgi:hypothetical protein
MFAFIAFCTAVLVLVIAAGQPYRQSWYQRWGPDR